MVRSEPTELKIIEYTAANQTRPMLMKVMFFFISGSLYVVFVFFYSVFYSMRRDWMENNFIFFSPSLTFLLIWMEKV